MEFLIAIAPQVLGLAKPALARKALVRIACSRHAHRGPWLGSGHFGFCGNVCNSKQRGISRRPSAVFTCVAVLLFTWLYLEPPMASASAPPPPPDYCGYPRNKCIDDPIGTLTPYTTTVSPIPTNTPTTTSTHTPSATFTATLTTTPTRTPSVTFTTTPTTTPTRTPSATFTATFTTTSTRRPSATFTATPTPTLGVCGNGELDVGETCDDGNNVDGDCCTADCRLEPLGAPCDDGLSCTVEDHCDGLGVCRSDPSNGHYAILRWSPADPLGSFTTLLGRRALITGHVCSDVVKLAGAARVLGDAVGLMTANNALYFGKRTQVAGTVVTAGGAIVGAENARIGNFVGADASGSAPQLSECANARARVEVAHSALSGLASDPGLQFGAVVVAARSSLRVPSSGTLGAGTVVVDFEDLKLRSNASLELVGGPNTADVVVRVRNNLHLSTRARVTLTGLFPNQVVFVVSGRTSIGGSARLAGTLIGNDRIAVRRRAVVEGGLFGKTVLVSGSARVLRAGWVGWCR